MQINSAWLTKIQSYGYTQHDLQYNSCKNIQVGAWILSQELAKEKNFHTGLGNYHSHTYQFNNQYFTQVSKNVYKIQSLLNSES